MRIAFTIPTFLPASMTGPIRHINSLSRGLATNGHDVTIITTPLGTPKDTVAVEENKGVTIRRLSVAWRFGHWAWCPELRSVLHQGGYDVVHSQLFRNYLTEVASSYCTRDRVPFVLTPRGSLMGYRYLGENWTGRIPNEVYDIVTWKKALRNAFVVVTSAQEFKDALTLGVRDSRIGLIPHGVDFSPYPPQPMRRSSEGTRLLFVGRLTRQRNVEFLLRGFALALRSAPKLRLSIVGDPIPSRFNRYERRYLEDVHALARSLSLVGSAQFRGGLYDESLWREYLTHDLFVYTSRYDNFGHALIESAYFGLPIISTDQGVAREIVGDGEGGFIVADDDDKGLATAILRASSNDEWRRQASSQVEKTALRFSMRRNVQAHESLYQTMISSSGS